MKARELKNLGIPTGTMVPEGYWRLWADPIIHAIHMRVLRHIASLSEAALQGSTLSADRSTPAHRHP